VTSDEATTWTKQDGDVIRVGVTADVATKLGDIIHFEPPELGARLTRGHSFGELESVKAITDVLSPLDGEVVEVNEGAVSSPESVSDDPDSTWLIAVRQG
jgi:glycine cleavage system H protein